MSALRQQRENSHDEVSVCSPTGSGYSELSPVNEQPSNRSSDESVSPPCIDLEAEPEYENGVKDTESTTDLLHDQLYNVQTLNEE